MSMNIVERSSDVDGKWEQMIQLLKGMLYDKSKHTSICQGLVSRTYITGDAVDASDFVIIATTQSEGRGRTVQRYDGFVIGKTNAKTKDIYIDVVCARKQAVGMGKKLLDAVETYAREKNFRSISLSSLSHVIGYYYRIGFRFTRGCDEQKPEIGQAYTDLAEPFIKKTVKNNNYSELIDTPDADDFKKFVVDYLIKNKLTRNKRCKTFKTCEGDGFSMSKCVSA